MQTIIENANVETKVTATKKEVAPKKVKAEKKETAKLTAINLQKFTERLKDFKEVVKSSKSTIYSYPENWTALQINSSEGKQFRSKQRTKINNFANNIFVYAKTNNAEKLKETVKEFEANYKSNYQINDFSLQSISQSTDEPTKQHLNLMLEIIKEVQKELPAKKETKAKAKK